MNTNEQLQAAVAHHRAGRLQEAANLDQLVLQAAPNQPDANHNLGLLAVQTGQAAVGLPFLKNAWKQGPGNEQYCSTLADCLLKLGQSSDAYKILSNAVERKGFQSAAIKTLLGLATDIQNDVRPSLAVEAELHALFGVGQHPLLRDRLLADMPKYPSWWAGWDLLCTVQQVLGEDCNAALERALELARPASVVTPGKAKVFCIGFNKTGTTSVESVLRSVGLTIGNQAEAEMLVHDWGRRDFRRILAYCQSADAFQDIPFSLPGTFAAVDQALPGSKFILTVRSSADKWFNSLERFHTQIVGKGRVPTAEDLREFNYRYPGYIADVIRLSYSADGSPLYAHDPYTAYYEAHNAQARQYFKDRPEQFLELNCESPDAMEKLLTFLGVPFTGQEMPRLNASGG
jgi:tetratricopeptide (TPR) repeat protein